MNRLQTSLGFLTFWLAAFMLVACSGGEGDFSLSLSTTSLSLAPGSSETLTVKVNPRGNFAQTVALSLAGDTGGVTATFEPSSTADQSTLTLTAEANVAAGERSLSVQGSGGGRTGRADFSLLIETAKQEPDPSQEERYSSELGELRTFSAGGIEFQYEVIDGLAVYQGDMILGPAERLEEAQQGLGAQGIGANDEEVCDFWIFFCENPRWPNGIVPYVISSDFSSAERSQVQTLLNRVAQHHTENTNIRLAARRGQADYIVVKKPSDPRVCGSSWVGRQGGAQDLNLSPTASFGCALHELNHALGVPHEQSREDRDSFVRINLGNIPDDLEHNFERAPTDLFFDHGSYDFDSLMHYGAGAFSTRARSCASDPSACSIVPLDSSIDTSRFGQRSGLSEGDTDTLCQGLHPDVRPRVSISSPVEGATFEVGETVRVAARITDQLDVQRQTQARWSSNIDGELRNMTYPTPVVGGLYPVGTLSVGTHTLTLETLTGCTNSSDTVEITITGEATLRIASPSDGSSVSHADPVNFRAATEGFTAPPDITWSSSIDGVLGESSDTLSRSLSLGEHLITATTSAPNGGTLSSSASVTVTNSPPRVAILEPNSAGPFCADTETILLRANVYDPDERSSESVPEANIVWTLNGGTIGTGREVSRTFPVTSGTIIVTATDEEGASGTASLNFSTEACTNDAPEVAITQPAEDIEPGIDPDFTYDGYDDEKELWYKDVTLVGSATDTEDGVLSGSALVWTTDASDIQAEALGSGTRLTVRLYSDDCFGRTHKITLAATDSDGNVRTAIRFVNIWTLC